MKITGPDSLQQIQPGNIPTSKGPGKKTGFGNMLREALGQPNPAGGVQSGDRLTEPRAVQNIGQQPAQPGGLANRTSRAIDLLENYSRALSDPQKTLREIEPELTAFVSETESLYDDFLKTNRDDPLLKNVMEELLRTARLEGIRFRRGDYLDTE